MKPFMRVLLFGILVITLTPYHAHCMDDDSDDSALGATGYTFSSRGARGRSPPRVSHRGFAPPSYDTVLSETPDYPPPSYAHTMQEDAATTAGVQGNATGVAQPPSRDAGTPSGPPPPYTTLDPTPLSSDRTVSLINSFWTVDHDALQEISSATKMCFRRRSSPGSSSTHEFKAVMTLQFPSVYAGLLSGKVYAEDCQTQPSLSILTHYRWGWEQVFKIRYISSEKAFTSVPVYGQTIKQHNLALRFTLPSFECDLCFRELRVTPYPMVPSLVLTKPKRAEKNACRGQRHAVHETIALGRERWASQDGSARFVDTLPGWDFCIAPVRTARHHMEISVQTHAAELIRLLQGEVMSTAHDSTTLLVNTNVPGVAVSTFRYNLTQRNEVMLNVPVYACSQNRHDQLNITLRVERIVHLEWQMCLRNLRLPKP